MTYRVEFSEAAVKDLEDVDNSSREIVLNTKGVGKPIATFWGRVWVAAWE